MVDFQISPDGTFVAYVADQDTDQKFELFVVPVDKGPSDTAIKVSGQTMAGNGIKELDLLPGEYAFAWSPGSTLVGYRADQTTANTIELFTSDAEGVKNDKVSGTLATGGRVSEFKWDTTGLAIAYLADQDTFGILELYASLPDGGDNTKLSGDLVAGGSVSRFDWVPLR